MTKKHPEADQPSTYNPLDKKNLGESVTEALLREPVCDLPPSPFIGAGVYALYYVGDFELYEEISRRNRGGKFNWPIYVGKAVPAGARKGGFGLDAEPGRVLYNRLKQHASSIEEAGNLSLSDFKCRFLVVDDIWIPLGENLLIQSLQPVWNLEIDGFGNHDPGSGRYEQQRSAWDVIHPGRSWAERLKAPPGGAQSIIDQAASHIRNAVAAVDARQG